MGKSKQQQSNPPAGSNEDGEDGDALAGSTLEDYFATHKVSGHVSQHLLNISTDNDSDSYEDDYESETSTPKQTEPPSELAGMTLSDYLHVKEDTSSAETEEKLSRANSLRALPPQLAASGKKHAPPADVSGMSLDHYLGAASSDHKAEENGHANRADKKASPKVKRKSSKPKLSGPNSSLTPFQRRQKRKDKAKIKQQRNAGGGSSISKAILMTESNASPPTVLSVRDRERRKSSLTVANHSHHPPPAHHNSHSSASNPLPKLSASPSVRSISHKDHDGEDDAAEKLPPL
ncbi:hypothetical protein PHYSODRAFT_495896 [Phytophthora sojae]|uniref:Uncharacterized protein n=1 Tax=Phytophthora sojae (strain P6497) TaxID=1094619 RepID=G4Z7G7_PHYSP|nr:hypothetical protein PHYSODRAFT_495896 [Phytophthora sojae]EGZ20370.1 hypothetical protein PHYSODRAFT_495896 [Phytophthora sojae]|eukprot:XP_009523087.1 hypothetical protein PHYSODRAFT_495896 [Phytophthora sojae]